MGELLRKRAESEPTRLALTFLGDEAREEVSLSYGELDRQAQVVAAHLRRLGRKGDRVLLLYPPGLDFHAAFLGCLYAGMIAVPAYPPDPARLARSVPRLRAIAADARARIVATTSMIESMAGVLTGDAPELRRLDWLATDDLPRDSEPWWDPDLRGDTIAFLQYTSGSTGTPKGVVLTHDNLIGNQTAVASSFGVLDAVTVSWLPIYHDMGMCVGLLQPISSGTHSILLSPTAFLREPVRWLEAITRYRAGITVGPNFSLDLCVRKTTPEQRRALDLSSLHTVIVGSDPVRRRTLDAFVEAFSPCGFRREALYPSYGLAEATLLVSTGRADTPPVYRTVDRSELTAGRVRRTDARDAGATELVGCGASVPDHRIEIVDPLTLRPCAPEQIGEIWFTGPSVAEGYWANDAQTNQTFGGYMAETGDGPFLRTGDLGFEMDDQIFITSRIKDLIIVRGRNYHPADLELTAENSHESLRPGCCAAFSIDVDGEERVAVVAEVSRRFLDELEGTAALDAVSRAIRRAVAAQNDLAPHAVELIEPGTIPKTSSGKIQRRSCRAEFERGSLTSVGSWRARASITQARSNGQRLEAALASGVSAAARRSLLISYVQEEIAAMLGVEVEEIDPQKPLSEVGLDSLMAVELRGILEVGLGVTLSATAAFNHPTAAALAQLLGEQKGVLPPREVGTAPAGRPARSTGAEVIELVPSIGDISDADAEALLEVELDAIEGVACR